MSSSQESLPFPLDRPTPVPDDLYREIYGGTTICCMLMLVLYGVSVLQTYLYYMGYPNDRRVLKILVVLLFCMSTLHIIFLCHTVYHYHILAYHNPLSLLGGVWSLYMVTGTGVIICFLVQLFYTRMIYHLTKDNWRWLLTIVLALLIFMQVAFGIVTVVGEFREWDIAKLANIALNSMVPMFAARVASDSVTALSLCVLLHGARPNVFGSGKLVHILIIYSVNRFLLTTVIVIVQMIALVCSPDSVWAMIIDFVSVHLYVNSCLATLNSRHYLHNIDKTGTKGASGYLERGPRNEFEMSHERVMVGARPAANVDLNAPSMSDLARMEVDGSIKLKRGNNTMTSSV